MTPREASVKIGCSPQHVRTLIRTKKMEATKLPLRGRKGHEYDVSAKEVQRIKRFKPTKGWKRGRSRST